MTGAWAASPAYGTAVLLGPTQQAVYRYVMSMTEGGRRPYVTLATIAASSGKPVSSVHEALGRLRALGLIGYAVSMGRTGGHRLWRVGARVMGALDPARRRLAIARTMSRWLKATQSPRGSGTDRPAPPTSDPGASPSLGSEGSEFGKAMRRYGFRRWWTEEPSNGDDHGRTATRRPDTLGL